MNNEILAHLLTIVGSAIAAWLASRPGVKASEDQQKKIEKEITEKVLDWANEHIASLENDIKELQRKYNKLLEENVRLLDENEQLRDRVEELESELKKLKGV